jgi:hypothetical protein
MPRPGALTTPLVLRQMVQWQIVSLNGAPAAS